MKKNSFGDFTPRFFIVILAAFFVLSGVLRALPVVGGELGVEKAQAEPAAVDVYIPEPEEGQRVSDLLSEIEVLYPGATWTLTGVYYEQDSEEGPIQLNEDSVLQEGFRLVINLWIRDSSGQLLGEFYDFKTIGWDGCNTYDWGIRAWSIVREKRYDLWLGETRVTGKNKDNILNEIDPVSNKPTASFDPETGVLELHNPNITGVKEDALLYAAMPIKIKGTWKAVSSYPAYYGININQADLEILEDKETKTDICIDISNPSGGAGIFVYGCRLTLSGGELDVSHSATSGIMGHDGASLIVNGGRLWAKGTDYYSAISMDVGTISLSEGLIVTLPEGGYPGKKGNYGTVLTSEGNTVAETIIEPRKYDVWVQGIQVDGLNKGDVLKDGGSVKYTPKTETSEAKLTLNGASISGMPRPDEVLWTAGIFTTSDLELVLQGENTISGTPSTEESGASMGISSKQALTITGEGMLNVSSADASWFSSAIQVKNLLMESGTVTATGGVAKYSSGVNVHYEMTMNGGMLTAIGDRATDYSSFGIDNDRSNMLHINGGTLIAQGETGAFAWEPDLSKYDDPDVMVNIDTSEETAYAWNQTDSLAGNEIVFKYVKIKPGVKHQVRIHWSSVDGVDIKGQNPIVIENVKSGTKLNKAIEDAGYSPYDSFFNKSGYIPAGIRTPKPLTAYKSENDARGDGINLEASVEQDVDIYIHMKKGISEIKLTTKAPSCGTSTSTPKSSSNEWDFDKQTNRPEVTLPSKSSYVLTGANSRRWIVGTNPMEPYVGKLTGGNKYSVYVSLNPAYGYHFLNSIKASNVSISGGSLVKFNNYNYWQCTCIIEVKAEHKLKKTAAKAATYTATGNKEYWTCTQCKKVYSDAKGTKETTVAKMTIPKLTKADAPKPTLRRLAGENRFGTANKVAAAYKTDSNQKSLPGLIVANGFEAPDALSAGALASKLKLPIQIVNKTDDSEKTLVTWITKNVKSGSRIYIVGGTFAVRGDLDKKIKKAGYKVTRVAGPDRIGTNLEVLKRVKLTTKTEVLVAEGSYKTVKGKKNRSFHNALIASATGKPLLLVQTGGLTKEQKAFLQKNKVAKFVIIGNESSVSAKVESELGKYTEVERVKANNPDAMSVAVAKKFWKNGPKQVFLATSNDFADALTGGPECAINNGPLFLINETQHSSTKKYLDDIVFKKVTALGGPVAVPESLSKKVAGHK